MSADDKKPTRFEEAAKTESTSLIKDAIAFLAENKKWWLFPILGTLLLVSALLLLSGTAAAPFIYTLF